VGAKGLRRGTDELAQRVDEAGEGVVVVHHLTGYHHVHGASAEHLAHVLPPAMPHHLQPARPFPARRYCHDHQAGAWSAVVRCGSGSVSFELPTGGIAKLMEPRSHGVEGEQLKRLVPAPAHQPEVMPSHPMPGRRTSADPPALLMAAALATTFRSASTAPSSLCTAANTPPPPLPHGRRRIASRWHTARAVVP
jgi:hypothetical protein